VARACFQSAEMLFNELDTDRCGSIPYPHLRFALEARGLTNGPKLTELWFGNIDKDRNNRVDIGEFLIVLFFWGAHSLGSYRALFRQDLTHASNVKVGMGELERLFRRYDGDSDGALDRSQALRLFQERLPRVPNGLLTSVLGPQHPHLRFSEFVKLLHASLGSRLAPAMPPQATLDPGRMWKELEEGYAVLEEDFQVLGRGQSVQVADIVAPATHYVQAMALAQSHQCDACHQKAAYGCPITGCAFFVCQSCYNGGIQSHVPALPGHNRQMVTQLIRDQFAKADVQNSRSLSFFEYVFLASACCDAISYRAVCPTTRDAPAVKRAMLVIHEDFARYAVNDRLSWDALQRYFHDRVGTVPPKALSAYAQLAGSRGHLTLREFLAFLYLLLRPSGKYAHAHLHQPAKPVVPSPAVTVTSDTVSRPQLPQFSTVDLRRVIWGKQLGRGGQSTAYRVTYDGATLVCRKPNPGTTPVALQEMIRGARIHMKLRHPNIARMVGIHDAAPVCFLMELCEGGDVHSLWAHAPVNPIRPPLQWRLAMELAEALQALHTASPPIIHRDVKGANAFLNKDRHVLLADFDLATSPPAKGMCGTPGYMAPEVLRDEPYDCSVDIFAFGGFLYEVTHGCFPYSKDVSMVDFHPKTRQLILKGKTPTVSQTVPSRMRQLMAQCWNPDPSARPSAAAVVVLLQSMQLDFQ